MKKTTIIIIVLILLILISAVGIFFFMNQSNRSDNLGNNQTGENIENEAEELSQKERLSEAKRIAQSLKNDGTEPEEIVRKAFEVLDTIEKINGFYLQREPGLFTDLYSALIGVYENTAHSSSTRSDAVLAINKAAYLSRFDVIVMNAALKDFDNGRLYDEFIADEHTADTPVGVAYKAWYYFNRENYTSNVKDSYFAGFAIWTIALSLITNEPEAEWRDGFVSYIVNGYELIWPDEMETSITRIDQVLWLQNTLLISRLRLEGIYGQDIAYTQNDYQKRFQRIIEQAPQQRDTTIVPLARLGVLVMLYQKKASPEEIDAAVAEFITVVPDFRAGWFDVSNRNAQTDQGFLLRQLEEIAPIHLEVKQLLEQNGWKL